MSTIGIKGEGGSYIVGASSVDKSVPIDYGGSSFRSIRGDLTCLTVCVRDQHACERKGGRESEASANGELWCSRSKRKEGGRERRCR
jgi:hypothetical protein